MKIKIFSIILILTFLANFSSCAISEKKLNQVIISGYIIDEEILRYIDLCQKAHPEIDIEVKDYQQYGTTDNALKQLKLDINAGNCGDLFLSSSYFSSSDYYELGIFQDFNEIQGINNIKAKMLPNILKSIETNGHIYSIYPFYTLNCYATKKDTVSTEQWNRKGILNILNSFATNDINFFGKHTDCNIQNIIISEICNDYNNGNSLDKNWYLELIKIGKQLLEIEKNSKTDYSDELIFKNDEVICSNVNIDTFDDYYYYKKAIFADEITLIDNAYDKNTLYINAGIMLSMLSDSSNKENSWKVISYFMSDEFQKILTTTDNFPVFKDAFDTVYHNTLQEYYLDSNGNQVGKKDGTYIINGISEKFDLPKEEDLCEIYEILTSIDQIPKENYYLRKEMLGLISTEFNSNKKCEQIFDEINNAYKLYISETL